MFLWGFLSACLLYAVVCIRRRKVGVKKGKEETPGNVTVKPARKLDIPPEPDWVAVFEMFEKSNLAKKHGIDNLISSQPNQRNIKHRIKDLYTYVVEPLIKHYGHDFVLTSGFRCLALNRKLKSKDYSQHCRGEAVDFILRNRNHEEEIGNIKIMVPFDQLILEGPKGRQWIHCSFVKNRSSYMRLFNKDRVNDIPQKNQGFVAVKMEDKK